VVRISGEKRSKKKKLVPQRDFSGPYFRHTNFERAVIATNGRAPYNNKEVEMISRKFDPESYNFKNNWVNQVIQDQKLQSSPVSQHRTGQRVAAHSEMQSASVTATTVFQGINHSQLMGSLQQTHIKKPEGNGFSMTQ
jgi:hypothetical protein